MNPRLRRFLWGVLSLPFVLLTALLVLWLAAAAWNRFDSNLGPTATALLAQPVRPIPKPRENAYFALLGANAAPGQEPWTSGEQYWRRSESALAAGQSAPEQPQQRPGLALADCKDKLRCVAERLHTLDLAQLAQVHAVALSRYRAVRRYRDYATVTSDAQPMATPLVPISERTTQLWRALTARALIDGNIAEGLAELEADLGFWRMMASHADNVLVMMVAHSRLQRDYALVAETVAMQPALLEQWPDRWRHLLAPLPPDVRDIATPIRGEQRLMALTLLRLAEHHEDNLLLGWDDGVFGRLANRMAWPLYQPQTTVNHYLDIMSPLLDATRLSPRDYAQWRLSHPLDPQMCELWRKPSFYFSNPIGKVLVCVALTDFGNYVFNVHRTEAMRRAVLTQFQLIEARPDWRAPQAIQAALQAMPATLANPLDGKPMQYVADGHLLRMAWRSNNPSWGDIRLPLPDAPS